MHRILNKTAAWLALAHVVLVGGLGTGLHALLGCEHGLTENCSAACCVSAKSTSASCEDCVYCRRAAEKQNSNDQQEETLVADAGQCCGGCAVCDLLAQYQSVTPFAVEPLAIELASGEAPIQHENAVIAAAIRLSHSRGPPVA
ncbi:MAG: hypothetical protein AAGA92_04775 [Planctomycetota bacterium]